MGLPRHPVAPSPCRRRVDRIRCSLEPRTSRYPAVGSGAVTEDNLALDVRGPPGKTAVRMALTGRLLIRMRALLQVQPSPQSCVVTSGSDGHHPSCVISGCILVGIRSLGRFVVLRYNNPSDESLCLKWGPIGLEGDGIAALSDASPVLVALYFTALPMR
jgi:hypothetical protein